MEITPPTADLLETYLTPFLALAGDRRTAALLGATVRGIVAELELPAGAALATGKLRDDVGQLEGKAYKHTGVSFWPDYNVTDDRKKVEWIVRANTGETIAVAARHERAGTVRTAITLA